MFKFAMPLFKIASNTATDGAAAAAGGMFAALGAAMMGIFWVFYCFAILLGLASLVLWVWALIDCLKRDDYKAENEKLLWALVIIFAGIIGAVIYYFLVKMKKEKIPKEETER